MMEDIGRVMRYNWIEHLSKVPNLPLPSLEETLARYLKYVEVMCTEEERVRTENAVRDFARTEGPTLHEELKKRRERHGTSASYVKPFWDDMYLGGRYPVPIHSNPAVMLNFDRNHETQSSRASSLIRSMTNWWVLMRSGQLKPDVIPSRSTREKEQPLCVEAYFKLLGTVRVPLKKRDELRFFPKSRHVILYRGSRVFSLEVIDEENRVLAYKDIKREIERILCMKTEEEVPPLSLLTSLPRESWARARNELLETNREAMRILDTSLFVLSLDTISPGDTKTFIEIGWDCAAMRQALAGDMGEDRAWQPRHFDKLTVHVAPDSSAAFVFEHSPYDAVPLFRMFSDVHLDTTGVKTLPNVPSFSTSSLKEIMLNVSSRILREDLKFASQKFRELCNVTKVYPIIISGYGKKRLKSWGLSPDGICQMAFQMAYYALHGEKKYPHMSVYESVSTNKFRHGRTEAGRTVTSASANFVLRATPLMMRQRKRVLEGEIAKELREMLETACEKHSRRLYDSGRGHGVDRHLFSLYKIALERGRNLPSLYTDPLWTRLNTSILSTSRVDATHFASYISYGAVCAEGYGVPYMIGRNTVRIGLTSFSSPPDVSGGFGGVGSDDDSKTNTTSTDIQKFGALISQSFKFLSEICESAPVTAMMRKTEADTTRCTLPTHSSSYTDPTGASVRHKNYYNDTIHMAYANNPTGGNSSTSDIASDGHVVYGDYRNELRMEDTSKPLWRAQNELPSLPIPTLEESCKRYLASVKALMSHEEFQNTKKAVKEFLEPGGIGETLQKRLQQRQKEQGGNNSWLQSWWNEYSYLGYREPNVIYVSYFYHFRDRVLGESLSQTRQASALVRAALEFRHLVATSTLEPDFQGRGKNRKPICSTPYKYMFNSCRIPRSGKDVFYMYPPNAPGCNSILVIRKNRFYICDVADRDGNLVSASALEKQLESIKAMADSKKGNVLPLGILTTWGRDDWTTARGQILKDGGEEFLDALQRTILCLCLDDTSPNTKEQCSRTLWHGDGKNRFFDKSVQIVVCENGVSGMIGEHSMMDGAATLNMVNWIFDYLNKHESTMFDTTRTTILTLTPTEIQPPISDKTKWNCLNAERDFANLVKKHDLRVLQFNAYGSTQIKKMKCSPDAWAQMALQLAYRMTFGQVRAVYEPVSVRQFRQGRTETVRSVTSASRSFVEAMMAKSAPHGRSDFTHQQRTRLERLRDAASLHVKNIRDSLAGRGCDRHLLGLRLLLKNGERAALFEDTSYWETCHWYISSSALSSEYLENWGFGEVVTDGIGVAYSVKKNSLSFCVTSVHGFSDSYVLNLERALLAMKSLWEDAELSLSSKL